MVKQFLAVLLIVFFYSAPTCMAQVQPAAEQKKTTFRPPCARDTDSALNAAMKCAGWIKKRSEPNPLSVDFPAVRTSAESQTLAPAGAVPVLVSSVFTAIAQVAVDRAKRDGLSLVKEKLEDGVCRLKGSDAQEQLFPHTCAVVQRTELQALVGQGRALRAAISGDIVRQARNRVDAKLLSMEPPIVNVTQGVFDLLERLLSDPEAKLIKTDVWMPVSAYLETEWTDATTTAPLEALQVATAAARVYLQAIALQTQDERTKEPPDLGYIVQYELARCRALSLCGNLDAAREQMARVFSLASIVVRAALSLSQQGYEDVRDELRSAIQLVKAGFEQSGQIELAWTAAAAEAALDADAPRLIASLADLFRAAETTGCSAECVQRRKVAALLTGISTYAMTYEALPSDANATAEQRIELEKQRQEARKAALEAVINAATDRRGREGDVVWSLGAGVGLGSPTLQKLKQLSKTTEPLQLKVPLGFAVQRLPGDGWPIHLMLNFVDLGNYVNRTDEDGTAPDWRAIFAPGIDVGFPLSTSPKHFFVGGLSTSFVPRIVESDSTTARSAWKIGGFLHFYVPLWDFN